MSKFYSLVIKDWYKETPDCAVLSFAIPQHINKEFAFKQGQYLNLKTNIEGEEVVRSYSLCTAPYENEWKVAIKKIEGGKFSTFANQKLKKGDTLEVMPPDGKFFKEVNPSASNKYVAFAAGSGITPVISILKTHLHDESNSSFTLFYLNKNKASVIFKKELQELENAYPGRLKVYYFYSQEKTDEALFNGRFSEEKLKTIHQKIIPFQTIDHCFICGPQEMIFLIKDTLTQLGVNEDTIRFELFEAATVSEEDKSKVEAVESEVTIIVDDEELTFTVPKGKSILEIAEEQDADVPFSCKGGVCCTCKAKVLEGSVEMLVNYALDEIDLQNNLVLTCQAIPTSAKVVVDYDDVY